MDHIWSEQKDFKYTLLDLLAFAVSPQLDESGSFAYFQIASPGEDPRVWHFNHEDFESSIADLYSSVHLSLALEAEARSRMAAFPRKKVSVFQILAIAATLALGAALYMFVSSMG